SSTFSGSKALAIPRLVLLKSSEISHFHTFPTLLRLYPNIGDPFVSQEARNQRLQILRRQNRTPLRTGHHFRGGPQRLRQDQRGRQRALGHGGTIGQGVARSRNDRCHFQRHRQPQGLQHGRSHPDPFQRGQVPPLGVRRNFHHPP